MSDYICRVKVIEEINKLHMTSGVTNQGTWNECVDVIAHTISEFESANVRENIKGEWTEWKGRNGRYNGIPICSNCNTGFPVYAKEYKFCPNCGADMRGE